MAEMERICLQFRRPGFDPWVGNISWRRQWLPTPVFWPREFYGQRNLAGYSPWGCKESDFTEQRSLLTSICRYLEFFICIAKPPLVFCSVKKKKKKSLFQVLKPDYLFFFFSNSTILTCFVWRHCSSTMI